MTTNPREVTLVTISLPFVAPTQQNVHPSVDPSWVVAPYQGQPPLQGAPSGGPLYPAQHQPAAYGGQPQPGGYPNPPQQYPPAYGGQPQPGPNAYAPPPGYGYPAPPPPAKNDGAAKVVLIIVVIVIVLVLIMTVIAGAMMVFMTSFSANPGDEQGLPVVSIRATTFSNAKEGITTNGGGWLVEVISVKVGIVSIPELTVSIRGPSGAEVASLSGAAPTLSDLSGSYDYYLDSDSPTDCSYWDGTKVTTDCRGISGEAFTTTQNATAILLDNDGSGTLTASDTIVVYSDNDGDGSDDVRSGSIVTLSVRGTRVATTDLG